MCRVVYLDSVGQAIGKLLDYYDSGEVVGLLFQVVFNDGSFATCKAGDMSYLEMIGLLEAAKEDVRASVYGVSGEC